MKLHQAKKIRAQIPTASMADIAFLLIVFFMVTTKFQVDKKSVALPPTVLRPEILAESAFISVTKPEQVATAMGINGSVVSYSAGKNTSTPVLDVEDLQQRITSSLQSEGPDQFFVLKIDEAVPCETFDAVLSTLKDAGAKHVTFLSRLKAANEK